MKIVADSYAWVELFLGSQKGERVRELFTQEGELFTPDVVLAEVARKYSREGVEASIIAKRLKTIVDASVVVPVSPEVALGAAKAFLDLREGAKERGLPTPGLFDAIVLAVGRSLQAKVLTGDPHFEGLPETQWIG